MGFLRRWVKTAASNPQASSRMGQNEPPPGRFLWSKPGNGGAVSYALRPAVRARVGEITPTEAGWGAFLVDIDVDVNGGSWLRGSTIYATPLTDDWGAFVIPDDAVIHTVECIADEATTTRLSRGTPVRHLGENYDPTEGIGGYLGLVLDGPFEGEYLYLGTGGRFGDRLWAAGLTLVPGASPQIADAAFADEILPLMHEVAIAHGAPGYFRPVPDRSQPA